MSVYRPRRKDGSYKTPFWHYDFVLTLPSGERRRFHGSSGQATRRAAQGVEARVRELAALGKLGHDLTLSAAAWRYTVEVARGQASEEDTLKSLEHLCRLAGGETPLVALTADIIVDAARRRAAETVTFKRRNKTWTRGLVSGATVNRQIVEMARRLLRRAKRVWGLPVDIDLPWADLKRPETGGRVRILQAAERSKLQAQTREDYRPIMEVYRLTGVRKAALCGLKKSALDWERSKHGGVTIMLKRRRGELPRPHFIPFTAEIAAIFRVEIKKSPLPEIFTYKVQRGAKKGIRRPITYNGLRRAWDGARKGIEDLHFHDQRHDAATRILRATHDLALTGRLLGHADLSSTMIYAHMLDDDLLAGMEAEESQNAPSRNSPGTASDDASEPAKNRGTPEL